MQHFPIFVALAGRRVVVSGGGAIALAKIRLLLKTEARITVFSDTPDPEICALAEAGEVRLVRRRLDVGDALCAALAYAANGDPDEDARAAHLARADGALVNIVDNLADSQFITPAIVDRDPVTVAIGTEGAAPVLARAIKRHLEEELPPSLGILARTGKAFRRRAQQLAQGRVRQDFWRDYYFDVGPRAVDGRGEVALQDALERLLERHLAAVPRPGRVDFVGAGPGDPELLTLKARRALDEADVVIHDRLLPVAILELVRREATVIEAGKTGFGPSTPQAEIDAMIVAHAAGGAHVVRLKAGDPGVYGRLDEEIAAVEAAGIQWRIVPGVTAAAAGAAALGQSLTRRGRNSELRLLTGHDVEGFAEHDWSALARPGTVAAIYMGKTAARFLQGRLLMHGADPSTPVGIVASAARPDQTVIDATLADLSERLVDGAIEGPVILFLGLGPRLAVASGEAPAERVGEGAR
jgi:uroporphyrin-III C-methyltransferase / precorrin-2 dehydrogenase / sirohydrochlorin ferrochelatase